MYFNGKKFVSVKVMSDGAVPVETELDGNSDNPVSNRAVYKALQGISNFLNGIVSRLSNAEQAQTDLTERVKFLEENPPEIPKIIVDDHLDLNLNSTNPVQNKVVTAKIHEVGSAAGNAMSTASAAHQRITTLETQVGDIDTALDAIIAQQEQTIAQQEQTIAIQEELIGGDGE